MRSALGPAHRARCGACAFRPSPLPATPATTSVTDPHEADGVLWRCEVARSSHRPPSPRTQGPWGRWRHEILGRTSRRNTAPGDLSGRPFARHTRPQHRDSPPGGGTMDLLPVTSADSRSQTVRRSAQRASRSPSQGRRPWWLPPPPRPAQRANRSTNRAGGQRNCWPVGPAQVVVGPTRPAGPGWENGWPLGPQDACCPSARATTDSGGVPEGSRGSSAATTPGYAPPTSPAPWRGA